MFQKSQFLLACAVTLCGVSTLPSSAHADDQTKTGAGNQAAIKLARKSPVVQSAYDFLIDQAYRLRDEKLRRETVDALNDETCVRHRANLSDAEKNEIVQQLLSAGLLNPSDAASIQGGVSAGVFPALIDDNTSCPKLPQKFWSSPGSVSLTGHHSYPGGLVVHESNNDISDIHLADQYREVYGHSGERGLPVLNTETASTPSHETYQDSDIRISEDLIIGAPIWHDWAKPMVYQWNADGTEFVELNFGGTGTKDNYGTAGDSRTGGHHIITIAEEMARGLSPAFVITQACAHSAPTSGNEYKVVNWLRAGAIIARIDPVAAGYLTHDSKGNLRLPPLRNLGNGVNLNAAGQTNVLVEYTLHNLSDSDFTYSGPAVIGDNALLAALAPSFGYDPSAASYYLKFRNPVLSYFTAERLLIMYQDGGLTAVRQEVQKLRDRGAL